MENTTQKLSLLKIKQILPFKRVYLSIKNSPLLAIINAISYNNIEKGTMHEHSSKSSRLRR